MANEHIVPILDLSPYRMIDGETIYAEKQNNIQLALEGFSYALNQLRTTELDSLALKLTGGNLYGDVTWYKADPTLDIQSAYTTSTSTINFSTPSGIGASIVREPMGVDDTEDDGGLIISRLNSTNASTTAYLKLGNGSSFLSTGLTISDKLSILGNDMVVWKNGGANQLVEDYFYGANIRTVYQDYSEFSKPIFITASSGNPVVRLNNHSGKRHGEFMLDTATDTVSISKFQDGDEVNVLSSLKLDDAGLITLDASDVQLVNMGNDDNSVTTKKHVADNYIHKDITDLIIEDPIGSAQLVMRSKGASSQFIFQTTASGSTEPVANIWGLKAGTANRLMLRTETTVGGTDAIFNLYETYADINVPFRGSDGTRTDNFTTQQFLADNYLSLTTGGTITDNIRLKSDNPTITIDGTDSDAFLEFERDSVRDGLIYATSDGLRIRRYAGNSIVNAEITLYGGDDTQDGGYIQNSVEMRGVDGTLANSMTTKGYVDDNENIVQQPAAYEMVMPTTAPTAGQSLEVDSVSGTVVTMKWV